MSTSAVPAPNPALPSTAAPTAATTDPTADPAPAGGRPPDAPPPAGPGNWRATEAPIVNGRAPIDPGTADPGVDGGPDAGNDRGPDAPAEADKGLLLPHEREQSAGNTAAQPDPVVAQAARDIAAGQVDTDLRNPGGLDAERRAELVRRGSRGQG